MALSLLLLFFVVSSSFSAPPDATQKPGAINEDLLANIFGKPGNLPGQAAAVLPFNSEYYDTEDNFKPSPLDYDAFDWTLTKRLASLTNESFLLSPLGLKLSLAILTEAATGSTHKELVSVLGFDMDVKKNRMKFSTIISSLETQSREYELDLGSRIYLEKSVVPSQRFASIAQEYYKTNLTDTDFSIPAVAASDINGWVANMTHGKITELVNEHDVSGVVLMILNTLYFRGTWLHQFAPNATRELYFYVSPTVKKVVPFMHTQQKFYYAESMKYDAKILRMPYRGHKFSMYIVVPNSLTGLPLVLENINSLRDEELFMTGQIVDVKIPKFTFDYKSQLDGLLKELGLRQVFEDTASFPGLARGAQVLRRLSISKILQKAGIELNEIGSVAYAATEISLVNKFGVENEVIHEVVANKPFLFYIEDEATKQLLFTGRMSDPTQGMPSLEVVPLPAKPAAKNLKTGH